MGRFKCNFQTKVLIPVVGVLVLFFVATMWLLSRRMQAQLRNETSESLTVAQSVFTKSLKLRSQNLQAQINPLVNQPSFMPMFVKEVRLNDEKTLQQYLADILETVSSKPKAALFTTEGGNLLAGA